MTRLVVPPIVLALLAACGGAPESVVPAPAEPETAIREFMSAVADENLEDMAGLWGGERGPALRYMDRNELHQRLTVIQIYLEHERYDILPPGINTAPEPSRRHYQVRIENKGCRPVVPFTLIRYRGGWLVNSVDLGAVGNPAKRCN
jgi:hypothetical protein